MAEERNRKKVGSEDTFIDNRAEYSNKARTVAIIITSMELSMPLDS